MRFLSLFLLPIINLVILAALVFALLDVVAVAVDDDLDFLVKVDDALVAALLFLEGVVGDGKAVVDADVVLRFVVALVFLETLNHFGLLDDLLGELLHVEGLVFLEETQRLVQQLDLVGFGDLERLGQLLRDEALGHRHGVVCVGVFVFALAEVEEIVHPVLRLDASVGVVDDGHHKAFLAVLVENEAAFVQFLQHDALLAVEAEAPVVQEYL